MRQRSVTTSSATLASVNSNLASVNATRYKYDYSLVCLSVHNLFYQLILKTFAELGLVCLRSRIYTDQEKVNFHPVQVFNQNYVVIV